MVVFDPLSLVAGAGGMGAVAAYALAELREARKDLLSTVKEAAQAQKELAVAMTARAETDRALRHAVDRLRDSFVGGKRLPDLRAVDFNDPENGPV